MFYLMAHSTYLWLCGKEPFRQQEKKSTATTTWAALSVSSRMAYIMAFVSPVVEHWLE